ncbi:unnamed protein product, partial [marine sediment metagenome]
VFNKNVTLQNSYAKNDENSSIPQGSSISSHSFLNKMLGKGSVFFIRGLLGAGIILAIVLILNWKEIFNLNWKGFAIIFSVYVLSFSIISFKYSGTDSGPKLLDMHRGINIGNALEAPKGEKWDVVMKEEYIDKIASAGFDTVRIPIRFSDYVDASNDYELEDDFMKTVDYFIKYALSKDLNVVMDMHHFEEIMENPLDYRESFLKMWDELSKRYSGYSEKLAYEVLNEPTDNLNGSLWNEFLKEAVETIRKNDKTKYIVIGGDDFGSYKGVLNLKIPNDDKLIVTFHYYDPNDFTFQGEQYHEGYENLHDIHWNNTEEERLVIINAFKEVKKFADKNGVKVFLGEFGANKNAPYGDRVLWTKAVREIAEENGFSWGYWEMASGFGIYDVNTHKFDEEMLRALGIN